MIMYRCLSCSFTVLSGYLIISIYSITLPTFNCHSTLKTNSATMQCHPLTPFPFDKIPSINRENRPDKNPTRNFNFFINLLYFLHLFPAPVCKYKFLFLQRPSFADLFLSFPERLFFPPLYRLKTTNFLQNCTLHLQLIEIPIKLNNDNTYDMNKEILPSIRLHETRSLSCLPFLKQFLPATLPFIHLQSRAKTLPINCITFFLRSQLCLKKLA